MLNLSGSPIRGLEDKLGVMNRIQAHRGPDGEGFFARNLWGFFCLELWQQRFHDRAAGFRALLP